MFIVLGQVQSYPLICVFTFLLSLVNEAFRPANSSSIAFYSTPENRTRSYSLNRLAINLGWAVGASIGGLVAAFDYELLFWVDGFTNISAAFLLIWLLPKVSLAQQQNLSHGKTTAVKAKPAYADKKFMYLKKGFISMNSGLGY